LLFSALGIQSAIYSAQLRKTAFSNMSDGLKNKTWHALFCNFLKRFGQQEIQLVISNILARLLLREEFGLIAMLAIFMSNI
jgi:hypothetical protein